MNASRRHPLAKADIEHKTRWYDAQKPGLGTDFLDEVKRIIGVPTEQPFRYRVRFGNWCLAREPCRSHISTMKTASVQQVPQQWTEILGWVAAGEEVEVMEQEKVVARVVPANPATATTPDFLARARVIWGDQPPGKSLSAMVIEDREGQP